MYRFRSLLSGFADVSAGACWSALLILVGHLGMAAALHAAEPLAKGVQFFVGYSRGKTAVGRVDIEQILTVPQKRGFLSIAALPVLVASGVQIQSREPLVPQALREIPTNLQGLMKGERIELRKFRIICGSPMAARLFADEVVFGTPESWQLRGVRIPGRLEAKTAMLCLGGESGSGIKIGNDWIPMEELTGHSAAKP